MVMVFVLIWSGFYLAVSMKSISENNVTMLFSIAAGTTTLFGMAGIGGYVWKDWIKSKHYVSALDKE